MQTMKAAILAAQGEPLVIDVVKAIIKDAIVHPMRKYEMS